MQKAKALLTLIVGLSLVTRCFAEQPTSQVIKGVCKLGYFNAMPDRYELSFDAGIAAYIMSKIMASQRNAGPGEATIGNDYFTCTGSNGGAYICSTYAKTNGVLSKNSLPLRYQTYLESDCTLKIKAGGGCSITFRGAVARHIYKHFVGIPDEAPVRLEGDSGKVIFNYLRWGKHIVASEGRPQNFSGEFVHAVSIQIDEKGIPAVVDKK